MSYETSFISKQPKLEPKLGLAPSETYPKQDVCFGCFGLISKQGVSVFRNKQKTNRNELFRGQPNRESFFEIFRFVSKKFCLFHLFRFPVQNTRTNRNKPKQNFLVSRSKPKNNQNRLSFGLFWIEPKKIDVLRTPYLSWSWPCPAPVHRRRN
jgi:hypothetical protein